MKMNLAFGTAIGFFIVSIILPLIDGSISPITYIMLSGSIFMYGVGMIINEIKKKK